MNGAVLHSMDPAGFTTVSKAVPLKGSFVADCHGAKAWIYRCTDPAAFHHRVQLIVEPTTELSYP